MPPKPGGKPGGKRPMPKPGGKMMPRPNMAALAAKRREDLIAKAKADREAKKEADKKAKEEAKQQKALEKARKAKLKRKEERQVGDRPYWLLAISAVLLVLSSGCGAAVNFIELIRYGFGDAITRVTVWRTCVANPDLTEKCFSVTSNSQCSELSSRLNCIALLVVITTLTALVLAVAVVAEGRGAILPVGSLVKMLYAWCILPLAVAAGLALGSMLSALCGDPLPLMDKNGRMGGAFYLMSAQWCLVALSATLYSVFNYKARESMHDSKDSDDDDDEGAASPASPASPTSMDRAIPPLDVV